MDGCQGFSSTSSGREALYLPHPTNAVVVLSIPAAPLSSGLRP
jgi:hypothetical protein